MRRFVVLTKWGRVSEGSTPAEPSGIIFDLTDESIARMLLDYETYIPGLERLRMGLSGTMSKVIQQVEVHGNILEADPEVWKTYNDPHEFRTFFIQEIKPEEEKWLKVRHHKLLVTYSRKKGLCWFN